MDQAQSKALAALQPFVHLATTVKSPSHRFLVDLINRATSAQGTYLFTELLQTSAIQSLRAADTPAESRAYLTLLEIFSYGTYEEYKSTPDLPELNEVQTFKLRQLSLLSLASPFLPTSDATNNLTYTSLLSALLLSSSASLESIVTTSIYSHLLTARLCPTSDPPIVRILSVAPLRDLRPQSLPALLQILQTWESRCSSVVTDLESRISTIRSNATTRNTLQAQRQEIVDTAVLSDPKPQSNENTDSEPKGQRFKGQKLGNKRDLEEHELDDGSEDDGRMEVDEGIGDPGTPGAPMSSSSRGTKRNRGRG